MCSVRSVLHVHLFLYVDQKFITRTHLYTLFYLSLFALYIICLIGNFFIKTDITWIEVTAMIISLKRGFHLIPSEKRNMKRSIL